MNRLVSLTAVLLGLSASAFAQGAKPPVLIELFTSKFCPNCPATERQFAKMADENADLLVVQEHVDYWDRGEMKDPYGSPDITQRQYDYSNTVGRRPGEVFTPQPILDGAKMVAPPMWLNLKDALASARSSNTKAALMPVRDGNGLKVALPGGHEAADVWVFGVEPIHSGSPVLRVRGMSQAVVDQGTAKLSNLPEGASYLVVSQAPGPGKVLGLGLLK